MAVTDNYIGAGMYDMICADINLPKHIRKEKRPLTEIEKKALSTADFTEREKAFIYIIYSCGLRRGEALALSIFDFNFKKGNSTVSITKALIFDRNASEIKDMPKTNNGICTIPISETTADFLKSYIAGLTATQLFTTKDGRLITQSSYVKMWKSIVRKMNAASGGTDAFPVITGLTAHIFRHNYCTNLCYKVPEISVKKIAQLMGDTEKIVLEVYNHIMEEKEDPASIINDVLAM